MNEKLRRHQERASDLLYYARNDCELIGDARRATVTDYLSLAYSLGYLTRAEFDHRSSVALGARYEHELFWAEHELPKGLKPPPAPPALPAVKPSPPWGAFAIITVVVLAWLSMAIYMIVELL